METYQVRDIPKKGLFADDAGALSTDVPFRLLWECTRVALENDLQVSDILPPHTETYASYDAFWSFLLNHPRMPNLKLPPKGLSKAWDAATRDFRNINLKAQLSWNEKRSDPLFKLHLEPLELGPKSCRFQRAFGADRFLYLEIPAATQAKGQTRALLKGQNENLEKRLLEWLMVEKSFLGRTWRAFHVAAKKKERSLYRLKDEFGQRVVLFATDGCDIMKKNSTQRPYRAGGYSSKPSATIADLIEWFIPLDKNSHQTFCKAYSRLDLGLSKTVPTIVFRPDQIKLVPDILADDTPEDQTFNDTSLDWSNSGSGEKQVMNDGCARISLGAARAVWDALGGSGPIPSAFQARMGGAKGVWMRSAESDSRDPDHNSIWIEINNSQLKFDFHDADLPHRMDFDPNRLTFEVLKDSRSPIPSSLHISFFPILLDRGIPEQTIMTHIASQLDRDREKVLSVMEDSIEFRHWLSEVHGNLEELDRDRPMRWQASLPLPLLEKIVVLLESGFSPRSNPFLGSVTQRLIARYYSRMMKNLRFPIGRSCNLLGIADPSQSILKPGEIHVGFSETFKDKISGDSYNFLHNVEVLIARHPALRRSDIQKYKAVFKLELSHLRDVIVFPTTGNFPSAAKLQGGDYDGDTFWVCWDPDLTGPFKNAPAPLGSPNVDDFGIQVDRRRICDVMDTHHASDDSSEIDRFLNESFRFASKPSFLGLVTNFFTTLSYWKDSIVAPEVERVADLHDLLIDSAKNGYLYDNYKYSSFLKSVGGSRKYPKPDYQIEMEWDYEEMYTGKKGADELKSPEKSAFRNRPAHMPRTQFMDILYFDTIKPHVLETLKLLQTLLGLPRPDPDPRGPDPDLTYVFENQISNTRDDELRELKILEAEVREWRKEWSVRLAVNTDGLDADTYNATLEDVHQRYLSFEPSNHSPEVVKRYNTEVVKGALTSWLLLKASALYVKFWHKYTMVFHVAGRELAHLKALAVGGRWGNDGVRLVTRDMWAGMKPRKLNPTKLEERVGGRVSIGGLVAAPNEPDVVDDEEGEVEDEAWDADAEESTDFYSYINEESQYESAVEFA
ncbi:hypothetical protein NA57DRAFT_30476 [Rhizodiscina lignyota]|uniref:RNA-dependent RNA polymerase n=1 Tax=Rhizodiscina lignyota TaxID=1504668 RepID=A0A9P4IMY7_9PEZI|nr:hypothetical protein NA57DRAFT_30476 [Rhizodiscina lignyota]